MDTVFGYLNWDNRQEHSCPLRFCCTDEVVPRQLLGMEGQLLLCTNPCAKDGKVDLRALIKQSYQCLHSQVGGGHQKNHRTGVTVPLCVELPRV